MVRVQDASGKEVLKARMRPTPSAAPQARPGDELYLDHHDVQGAVAEAAFEDPAGEVVARVEKSRSGAPDFSDRVLHAILLQDLGATQDAREAWTALAGSVPSFPSWRPSPSRASPPCPL